MIRSLWIILNLLVATLLLAGLVVLAAFLGIGTRIYDWAPRAWSRWMLRVSGTPVRLQGLEHVKLDGPQIFAANHQSWYDVFALAAVIPKRYRFVAKRELEAIPLFGRAWKAAGHISVDRGDRASAIRSLEQAGELIRRDNSSVVIFPEGTRTRTGQLLPFKKGAFMLALHTGVEIVPVAIFGTRRILPKGAWHVRPGPIIVRFGRPISTVEYTEADRDTLIAEVRGRIESLLAELPPTRRAS
ncbi:MAG: 1-acyl-sn-glycerol-3-phosphate acyltransferase [Gemmatimonadetes bacterium]|nr:1-acyl-sn-glycerol-3-phosphate acyltransferase [Gemmatimonadota bacterium]